MKNMKNTPGQLIHLAEQLQEDGALLAARLVAGEAVARDGGQDAARLLERLSTQVRETYEDELVAEAEAHCAGLPDRSGRFSIVRDTELNQDSGQGYACPLLNKHIHFNARGVSFCALTPDLACTADTPRQLTVLRLSAEIFQADLLLNKDCLCGHCPQLKKVPLTEIEHSYGPLHIHINTIEPETYDLTGALGELGRRNLLAAGREYDLTGQGLAGAAAGKLREIMAIMENNGLRGRIRTDPEVFDAGILAGLTRGRVSVVCEINERGNDRIWEQIRSYCASGHPELVTVRLTFEQGGLDSADLDGFLANCLNAGCRKLQVAFNERLVADDLLLENKDYLEQAAYIHNLELSVDKDSLDAVIFNRKASKQRAQTDWTPGSAALTLTGRSGMRARPGRVYGQVPNAVGQN